MCDVIYLVQQPAGLAVETSLAESAARRRLDPVTNRPEIGEASPRDDHKPS
jgi:hypothetical protein